MTKNATQGSIAPDIYPALPKGFLCKRPEPALEKLKERLFRSKVVQEKGKLGSLTGLRFFAALAIFFIHVGYFIPPSDFLQSPVAEIFLRTCSAGVGLFFLLSGFLLAYTHADVSPTSPTLHKFWTSRIARIYPVYLLALFLYAPFILAHRFSVEPAAIAIKKSLASLLMSLFLIQSWGLPRFAIAWNGPGWSLSVEAALYLAFPWMTYRLAKLSQRSLLLASGVLLLLSFCLSLGVPKLLVNWSDADLFVTFNPLFHVPTFGIGIALGCHFLRCNEEYRGTQWLAVLGVVSIVVMSVTTQSLPASVAHNSLFVLPFAILVYGLARGGELSRVIGMPCFVLLGEASYSFYILQFPLGFTFRWLNEGRPTIDLVAAPPGAGFFGGIAAVLTCSLFLLGISIVCHRFFEVPLRRVVLNYFQPGHNSSSGTAHRFAAPVEPG